MARPKQSRKKTLGSATETPSQPDALQAFLPEVADWFRTSVGTPTEAQAQGWPSIQAGQNTLIVAPTGSGKTLAAFLAGLDALWRNPEKTQGVKILYLSPLKALNQDIERNLDRPLAGVRSLALERGISLPEIRTAVRTGDTPTAQRQQQARKPPDILITTPESLHLILGSQARRILKPVRWIIVDELHALAGQKRGTFLAILLERLVDEIGHDPVRIGLTATVNPLAAAAQFLGGFSPVATHPDQFTPRPVRIINPVIPKQWDLLVERAEIEADPTQPRTIWPNLEKSLVSLIGEHNSSLIFANNRYLVERLSASINEQFSKTQPISNNEVTPVDNEADPNEIPPPDDAWVHAHHGSVSLQRRRLTEQALKEGRLKGVISTASLEMGIDMGAVDLVCQVGSPGEVARGLQRVGRAGHGVGQVSKGRFFAKTSADLLETAALVEAMSQAAVEPLAIPQNCLDLLAQQVVACVAVHPWNPRDLYRLFRRSYPYQDLPESAFESVLEMLSGRFRVESIRDLKARIFWDRVRNELIALPGSSALAMLGGGAIPDTGQYAVKLGDNGPTLGSLDEEFVLERRPGEAFRLGSSTWRIDRIEADRVIVSPSGGSDMVVMPFWRGEEARRSATLGAAIGALVRRVAHTADKAQAEHELMERSRLTPDAARELVQFIKRQQRVGKAVPDDRTIIMEAFREPAGEVALALLSPWGGRLHLALKLVLQHQLNQRLGFRPAAQHADDGLIMRLPRDTEDQPPLDLLDNLDFKTASDLLRQELADSALFGLRFRQNAARALLLPKPDPGKRTPLWLQRLRAKDLLEVVRQMPDFPVVLECYRECLSHDLDLELLETVLGKIASGEIKVVKRLGETASPFAADLMNRFERKYLYEWDEPHKKKGKAEARSNRTSHEALNQLLDPRIVEKLGEQTSKAWNRRAKSAEEFAERFTRLGDLQPWEVSEHHQHWLEELQARELCDHLVSHDRKRQLWISADELKQYRAAFPNAFRGQPAMPEMELMNHDRWAALDYILSRYVRNRPLTALEDITSRYPIEPALAAEWLARWTQTGGFTRLQSEDQPAGESAWADSRQMKRMVEMSMAQRRRDVQAVSPESWAAWVLNRSFANQMQSDDQPLATLVHQLGSVLMPLQGWAASLSTWLEEILPSRLEGVRAEHVDQLLALGGWSWRAHVEAEHTSGAEPRVSFHFDSFPAMSHIKSASENSLDELSGRLLAFLTEHGAATSGELARRLSEPLEKVRQALYNLISGQLITNEKIAFLNRFYNVDKPVTKNQERPSFNSPTTSPSTGRRLNNFRALLAQQGVGLGGQGQGRTAQVSQPATEGRWRPVEMKTANESEAARDERMAAWSALLMERYGVICREVARFGCQALDWPDLADWLEAAEWRGEVRRGYFVEGLSGLQFTTDDIAGELALSGEQVSGEALDQGDQLHLLSVLDPANLYGASAPLDLPLLENGRARLPRIAGNAILMAGGRPIWIIQESGKRLTSLPHASRGTLRLGLRHLIRYFTKSSNKWTITSVDESPPVKSEWADELAELGFVRDALYMTLYRGLM